MSDVAALQAAVAAVAAIHHPSTDHNEGRHPWQQPFLPYCVGCWEAGGMDGAPTWPCETYEAIAGVIAP